LAGLPSDTWLYLGFTEKSACLAGYSIGCSFREYTPASAAAALKHFLQTVV